MARKIQKRGDVDGLTRGNYEIGIQLSHRRRFQRSRSAYQTYPVSYSVIRGIGPMKREVADQIFEEVLRQVREVV